MITQSQIYWLVMLDSIKGATSENFGLALGSVILFIAMLSIGIGCRLCPENDGGKELKLAMKFVAPLTIVFMSAWFLFAAVNAFLPSTKQMAAIIVVPKVCNAVMADSALKKIPGQITTLASEWLEELKPVHDKPVSGNTASTETKKK